MLNSSKFLAEILLTISIISSSFPTQRTEVINTINNSSSFFITPIEIKKDDNLAPMDFSKIFGNPNPEDNNNPHISSKENLNFAILNTNSDNISIFKLGEKTIVINPGKKENNKVLLENLGRMQVSKIDAIILTDLAESTDNLYTLLEMGIAKKTILPGIKIQKNTSDFELIQKLKEIKDKIIAKGGSVSEMIDQTKINLSNSIITSILQDNTTNTSLKLEYNENSIFYLANLKNTMQTDLYDKKVNTIIVNSNYELNSNLLKKLNPEKAIIIERKDVNTNEETINLLKKELKEENILYVNSEKNALISMEGKESKFKFTQSKMENPQ